MKISIFINKPCPITLGFAQIVHHRVKINWGRIPWGEHRFLMCISVSGFGVVRFGNVGFEVVGMARSGSKLGGDGGVEIDPIFELGTVVAVPMIEAFEYGRIARARPG